jgi:hypothetical protein
MSRKSKASEVETRKARKQAATLGATVGAAAAGKQALHLAEQATQAGRQAIQLAEQGKDWAGPRVEAAAAWATPRAEKAWQETVKVAAPKIEAAAEKVRPAVDTAYEKIVADYLPRVEKAMHDAAEAASRDEALSVKAAKAKTAALKALSEPPAKSRGGVAKTVGWVLVGTAAAGTAYLLWRRSQPVDDPWAEEYWEDTTVTSPASQPKGGIGEKVAHAASGVKDKAASAATVAGSKASEAAHKAAGTVRKGGDKAKEASEQAATGTEAAGNAAAAKADEAAGKVEGTPGA